MVNDYDFKEATRYDVAKHMENRFGCAMINLTQIGEYTDECADVVREMMKGVSCYAVGKKSKRFHVLDVAKVIEARKTYI